MKDNETTQALSPAREISAKLTITDYRLRFATLPLQGYASLPTSEDPGQYEFYDAAEYGSGILQAARVTGDAAGVIRYRYVTDPAFPPGWSTLSTGIGTITGLALFAERIFVTGSAENLRYADFNGSAFGAFVTTPTNGMGALVAPVSRTDYFLVKYFSQAGQPYQYGIVTHYTNFATLNGFYGRLYDTAPLKRIDAVRFGGTDTLYATEETGKRTIYLEKTGASWSDVKYVIPLDVVDDVSMFKLGGVNLINSRVIVTGLLGRSAGSSMHIYSFGPKRYSIGRDMFISTAGTSGWGKLHLIGSYLWYIGPGVCCRAEATELVGYTNSAKTLEIENIVDAKVSMASSQAYVLTADLPAKTRHPALRTGSKARLDITVNGELSSMGDFNIDALAYPSNDRSQSINLVARSQVMKELATWESDAPYDYWSQTRLSTNPADLTEVIRTTGQWKQEEAGLTTYELNRDGYLYASARSSRNGVMRLKFRRCAGDWNARIGVGVNYYIETRLEASERLGKAEDDILEGDYGHNGIFAVFGKKEHNGGEGVGLYLVRDSAWTLLASAAVTLADDTDTWVQLKFREGYCEVRTRTTGAWSAPLIGTVFSRNDHIPWKYDYQGRGAIYVNNATPSSIARTFLGSLIVVDDNTIFPTSELIQIDDEIISYSGKSAQPNTASAQTNYPGRTGHGTLFGYYCLGTVTSTSPYVVAGGLDFGYTGKTKARQKLVSGSKPFTNKPLGSVTVRLYKVGNPTDCVKITIAKSTLAPRTSVTVKASDIPTWEGEYYIGSGDDQGFHNTYALSIPFAKTSVTTSDYIVFERTGDLDPNNYYKLGLSGPLSPAVAGEYYNGTAWAATTNPILTFWDECIATSGQFFRFLTILPADLVGCALKLIPCEGNVERTFLHKGLRLADQWVSLTAYNATTQYYTFSTALPSQTDRPALVYPTLKITARGMNGTQEVAHSPDTPICIYRAGPFEYLTRAEFFSSEIDLSLEDMVAEVVGKVGQYQVESPTIYPQTVIPSASNPVIRRRNVIAKINCANINGTIVLECDKPDAASAGHKLEISATGFTFEGETYPYANPGELTISMYNDTRAPLGQTGYTSTLYISIWDAGYVHTFVRSDAGTGEYFQISGTSTLGILVRIVEACMRVDNFILDNGKKGSDLISEMIGEKRFYFQETMGGIRLFRTRTEVNAGEPYRLAVDESDAQADINFATRIRIEGGELYEVLDEPFLVEHGNIFRLVHMSEVETLNDARFYGEIVMDELGSRYLSQNFSGAADPRIEPNDVIYVELPSGVVKVIVDQVDMALAVSDSEANFDMSISGRVPRNRL